MKNKKQKREGSLFLLVCVFLLAGAIGCFAQARGDVNNSGTVDILDAMMIAQYCAGLSPAGFVAGVADVNCSGTIEITDALRVAQYSAGIITSLACSTLTPTRTPTRVPTPTPTTTTTGTEYTGNSTWFTGIGGTHYGGCGVAQADLDTQDHVALNVQNTPQDYTTRYSRPIEPQYAAGIGMFNNGLNCGRWVRVTIGDYCNGVNDGAQNQPFCRGGTGWVADAYNGAVLDMVVGDSCQDDNAWCRDDPYHLDLSRDSLNKFVKDGKAVGDLDPEHFNNRQIHWHFIEAPNYTGDIKIGFMKDAQAWWSAISILHLKNGLHGVDYWDGTAWLKAKMNSDMGNSYIVAPTVAGGTDYRIRVYDVTDQLINNGRIYKFTYPSSCGTSCAVPFTQVSYTTE